MGLFGNSNTHTINEIHRCIGEINKVLRGLENSLNSNRGVSLDNAEYIHDCVVEILKYQQKADALFNSLSEREVMSLRLVWMDGRQLALPMWDASYRLVMNQLNGAIADFERKAGVIF